MLRVYASTLRSYSLYSPGMKYRSSRKAHTVYWVKEKKSKFVLIGICDHSLKTSDVSVPSID